VGERVGTNAIALTLRGWTKVSIDARCVIRIKLAWPVGGSGEGGRAGILGRQLRRPIERGRTTVGHRGDIVNALLKFAGVIDAINTRIGKVLSWLILAAVIVSAVNALIRKLFDTSSNAWLELQWMLFGAVFLLCASWTLLANEHIRIDIVNNLLPKRVRNTIELVGHVFFLLPLTIIMIITSVPFFLRSFEIDEQSVNAGGLPQWPAKALILIGFFLLFFQGISELIKRIAVMRGRIPDPHAGGGLHSAAEAEAERILAVAKSET
jgi:TRAP-type mannitol/chloroaromatic compound transport system permease small subunit